VCGVRVAAAYVVLLGIVSVLTGQYWVLLAGLAIGAAGMLLTSR
jgi:hypothetical protein